MMDAEKSDAELQRKTADLEKKLQEEFANVDRNIETMFEGKDFSESRRMMQDILSKQQPRPSTTIIDEIPDVDDVIVERPKTTPLDEKLAALKKRIEMNLSIIKKTNEKVNNINFEAEKASMKSLSKDFDYDEKTLKHMSGDCDDHGSKLNLKHPGIDEAKNTLKHTMNMIDLAKSAASGDSTENDYKMDKCLREMQNKC